MLSQKKIKSLFQKLNFKLKERNEKGEIGLVGTLTTKTMSSF